MKLKQKPAEHAELKLILELGLARGEGEARFVELRLAELNRLLQTRPGSLSRRRKKSAKRLALRPKPTHPHLCQDLDNLRKAATPSA